MGAHSVKTLARTLYAHLRADAERETLRMTVIHDLLAPSVTLLAGLFGSLLRGAGGCEEGRQKQHHRRQQETPIDFLSHCSPSLG